MRELLLRERISAETLFGHTRLGGRRDAGCASGNFAPGKPAISREV
jgi:hypothetical protein